MPLNRENRRRQITLNVTPYIYDVDAVALSLINQFKSVGCDPEVTRLDDYKLSLTFRESDELTYEAACQKILWNQYVQDIEQKNVANSIEILKKMLDPYFDSPVVANINEVKGDGQGQLDGISPSAFSDGEVLWADGQRMAHPSYSIGDEEVRVPAGGPMPLSKDINKAVQPSTITSSKRYANSPEMEDHFNMAIFSPREDDNGRFGKPCKFCGEPEYMAWEHEKIATHPAASEPDPNLPYPRNLARFGRGFQMLQQHRDNQTSHYNKLTCPACKWQEEHPLQAYEER